MRPRVAIIGSNSFVADYIIQSLQEFPCQIVGFSRNDSQVLSEHILFDYPIYSIDFDDLLSFDFILYCAGSGIQAGTPEGMTYGLNTFFPVEMALHLNEKKFSGKLITFGSYFEIGNNNAAFSYSEEQLLASSLAVPNSTLLNQF